MYLTRALAIAGILLTVAFLIFRRVGRDYRAHGSLTSLSSSSEFLIFFLHGCASYLCLDSNLANIDRGSWHFVLAIACILIGLVGVVVAISRLGMGVSVGSAVAELRQTGLYRYSKNPQLVAYLLVVGGYALLWPYWSGLVWVAIYGAIAYLMVRTEEEHLLRTYREEYERYCGRTPRFLGIPKR